MCAISMPTVLKLILNAKVIYTLVACKVLLDSSRKKKNQKTEVYGNEKKLFLLNVILLKLWNDALSCSY